MKPEIAAFQKAQPFVPFEVELVGGRVLQVPHPEFVYVPPGKGLYFVITHKDGVVETLNAILVLSVRPIRKTTRRKAG
jgi:hypothetical protein